MYIDYIKLWHYEPPRLNPEPEPEMKDGEGWYSDSFSEDIDGWFSTDKKQVVLSQEDDCLKYESTYYYVDGKPTAGAMLKYLSFAKGQYYKMFINC